MYTLTRFSNAPTPGTQRQVRTDAGAGTATPRRRLGPPYIAAERIEKRA